MNSNVTARSTTTPAPFGETVRGTGTNDVHLVADEVLAIRVTNPVVGGGPQAYVDLQGLRRLIEALETAEKHLTYNQRGGR
jgi:hypothetical protein